MRTTLLTLATTLGCGLGCSDARPIALSWQFADQRSCVDAGVVTVMVKSGSETKQLDCGDGTVPASVMVAVGRDGIHVDALSAEGATIYAGDGAAPTTTNAATVTLYAVGP